MLQSSSGRCLRRASHVSLLTIVLNPPASWVLGETMFVTAVFRSVLLWLVVGSAAVAQVSAPSARPHDGLPSPELSEASRALAAGDLDAAAALAQKGLAASPRSVPGLNLLGVIFTQEGKYDAAVEQFRKALAIEPNSVESRINLASTYAAAKYDTRAEESLRDALRLQPGNRTARYNLASLLLDENKPRAALDEVLSILSPDPSSRLLLVRARLVAGDRTKAVAAAEKLSHEFPRDARIHVSLAVLLASHHQYRQAEYEFELADALEPGSFDILHDLGKAYLLNGQYSKAQDRLNQALRLQPDSADTLYLLAQTAAEMQKEVDALELLVRAHTLAPNNTDITFLMAQLSMKQSFFEDAIDVLNRGVKIDPKRADFHAALGESYFTIGKTDKALQEFTTLLALDPSPRSYVFMGLCYWHLGKFNEAKRYLQLSLGRDPNNLAALYNLGVIARGEGDNASAETYLARAVKLDSDYPEAVFEFGNLRLDQQKFEEAASLFRHYVELTPKSAQGYYKLAMAEHRLHDNADADREMNIFRTLSKSPQPAPYPLQHLFDYLGKRNTLTAEQRDVSDTRALEAEVQQHPDRPRSLYLLAEALLREARTGDALQVLQRLDTLSGGDYRTELNSGILLGRFHQNDDAIRYFQAALKANPTSDDARYDLAESYFQAANDRAALEQLLQISPDGQKQASDLGLAGEVYAHLGQYDEAVRSLKQAIAAAPDDDQYYVSLALFRLRAGTPGDAEEIVRLGLSRIPDSAALYWTSGLAAIASGRQQEAETALKKASRLNASSQTYLATLGMLYYQEGRYSEASDVLKQCMELFPRGVMDFQKINAVLNASRDSSPQKPAVLSAAARTQLCQLAIAMRDQEQ